MSPRRRTGGIISLLPAATELVFVLDAWDRLRAVSHACDFPPQAQDLPRASRLRLDTEGDPRAIDRAVRALSQKGESLYELDRPLFQRIRPELVITQSLCDVCALTPQEVRRVTEGLDPQPTLHTFDPTTYGEALAEVRRVGELLDQREAAKRELLKQWSLAKQIRAKTSGLDRPRVAVLDWIDPPMFAGHWTQELVRMAGGDYDFVASGAASRSGSWDELEEAEADVIVAAPCGRSLAQTVTDLESSLRAHDLGDLAAVEQGRLFAADGNQFFNRPGPRLVYSSAILSRCLHPDEVPALPGILEAGYRAVRLPGTPARPA